MANMQFFNMHVLLSDLHKKDKKFLLDYNQMIITIMSA